MPQLVEAESRSPFWLLCSAPTQPQFVWAHGLVLREALEWGGNFGSLFDWYRANILPVSFCLVCQKLSCFIWNYVGDYFISITPYRTGLKRLTCGGAVGGRDNKQFALLSQGRDLENQRKADSSFCYCGALWIRPCCKRDIWLPDTNCLQIISAT